MEIGRWWICFTVSISRVYIRRVDHKESIMIWEIGGDGKEMNSCIFIKVGMRGIGKTTILQLVPKRKKYMFVLEYKLECTCSGRCLE